MTLTTTEELKHLASSDNANELTRRLARECLANREAQPVLYASEETLAYAKEGEKSLVTWSEPMGDAVIPLYAAPPAPGVVKLPATRLWAGVTECYEKSNVIAAIRAAGGEVSDD